jgi:hypothetical protein
MELSQYDWETNEALSDFLFTSEGHKGKIKKGIRIKEHGLDDIYNISFGDLDNSSKLNDSSISNNGDWEKILATVAGAIYTHTAKYPERYIYAVGRTASRTRLYQMGIGKYWDRIKNDFEVFGFINGKWQDFEKGINYESFLARRKTNQNEKDKKIKESNHQNG